MKSIKQMLERVHGLVDTADLTEWENKFVKTCWEFSKNGTSSSYLTGRQVEIIDQLYNKHFS